MQGLEYIGTAIAAGPDLGYKSYVDSVASGGLSQTQVDNSIASQTSQYALKSYVDSQDATFATQSYVDQQDALRLKLTDRGVANGVSTMNSSSQVILTQLPDSGQFMPRQIHTPTAYNGSTPLKSSSTTEVTLYTCPIGDPGYPYKIIAWGYCETMAAASTQGQISVRVGTTVGTVISRGMTRNTGDNWGDCTFSPNGESSVISGATTLYIRGSRLIGSGTVQFSNFWAAFYAMTVPVI